MAVEFFQNDLARRNIAFSEISTHFALNPNHEYTQTTTYKKLLLSNNRRTTEEQQKNNTNKLSGNVVVA